MTSLKNFPVLSCLGFTFGNQFAIMAEINRQVDCFPLESQKDLVDAVDCIWSESDGNRNEIYKWKWRFLSLCIKNLDRLGNITGKLLLFFLSSSMWYLKKERI